MRKKIGTSEHAIEHCKMYDHERRITKIRLQELGMRDTSIWNFVSKAGGPMKTKKEGLEQRRKVISEVNAYIGKIMARKKGKNEGSKEGRGPRKPLKEVII